MYLPSGQHRANESPGIAHYSLNQSRAHRGSVIIRSGYIYSRACQLRSPMTRSTIFALVAIMLAACDPAAARELLGALPDAVQERRMHGSAREPTSFSSLHMTGVPQTPRADLCFKPSELGARCMLTRTAAKRGLYQTSVGS